jgi:hypothetical protein
MKSMRWIIFGVILIGLIALSVTQRLGDQLARVAASTAPVVINFDNLTAGGPGGVGAIVVVNSQYNSQGITFNGAVALDYSKGLPIPGFAHSGNVAIEQCYSQEFCFTPIEMTFTAAQRRVKVWVGFRGRLDQARTVLLRGFDAGGAEVIRTTATLPASPSSQPIRIPLEITASGEIIKRAAVSFDPSYLMNGLAVDDVEFDTPGPEPVCSPTVAPAVILSQPSNGLTVQTNEFMLQGTINLPASAPLQSAILFVQGSEGTKTVNLLASNLSSNDGAFGPTRIQGMLSPGANTIYIEVQNCRNFTSVFRTVTYTPIASDARVELMGIEVTQAIQDINNTVPLIAGKRTVARVYLRLTGGTSEIRNVSAALNACRPLGDSSICGETLPNIYSLKSITLNSATDLTARRRDINASLNFELPLDWVTEGRLHLGVSHLEIDGNRLSLPCDKCDNPWPVSPIFPLFYQFQSAPPVRLLLVSVPYAIAGMNGGLPYVPRALDLDLVESWLRRAYPTGSVEVTRVTSTTLSGVPDVDFNSGDVNSLLSDMRSKDLRGGGDERAHYFGLVFSGGGFMRGSAGVPSSVGSGPGGACGAGSNPANCAAWDFDGSFGDWYTGHELGHTYGRKHPDFVSNSSPPVCRPGSQDGTSPDKDYPFDNGFLSDPDLLYFGFDVGDARLSITPQVYAPDVWTDMMTYCANEWISSYTYSAILDRLREIENGARPFAGDEQETLSEQPLNDGLFVLGTINLTKNSVQIRPFSRLQGLKATPRPANSSFSIDLLGAGGSLLARYPFDPKQLSDIPPEADKLASFSEVVAFLPGTIRIVISQDGAEIASRAVSANAPQVTITSPNGGETLQGEAVTVRWQANDADGDPLTFSVLYSANGGQSWQTLAVWLTGGSHQVNLADLPGSDRALFRVIATDGVNTGADDSDAVFSAPNKPPRANILSPASQGRFSTVQTVVFTGAANDLEDGNLAGAALQWSSDRQGALGAGRSIAVTDLAPGAHTITFEARDQSGAIGRASIQILVTAAPPVADAGPDQQAASGATIQFDGRNSRGFGSLSYQWTLLSRPLGSQATLTSANTAQPSLTGDQIGEYVVQLVVRDGSGAQAVDRVMATITCCGLTILARQDTGANLMASFNVTTPQIGARVTPFNLSLPAGDRLAIAAPATIGNLRFLHWRSITNNRVLTTNATLTGVVDRNETLAAIYQLPPTVSLNIVSICEGCVTGPAQFSGLTVNVIAPAFGSRTTPFSFELAQNGRVVITAPRQVTAGGRILRFNRWISVTDNRTLTTHQSLSGRADKSETLAAVYQPITP